MEKEVYPCIFLRGKKIRLTDENAIVLQHASVTLLG